MLKELAAWREREAQERDIPRQRMLRDETLMEIAAHHPASVDELARTRGMGKGMVEGRMGAAILEAVKRGLALPDDQIPKPPERVELPRGLGPVVDLLKVLLKMKCDAQGVASKLVANSADVEAIAADDHARVPALSAGAANCSATTLALSTAVWPWVSAPTTWLAGAWIGRAITPRLAEVVRWRGRTTTSAPGL